MHEKPAVTLDLLQLLKEIHVQGSISAAARSLDISPSLATRRLSALERAMQVSLFQRTTRRTRLTEGGRIALDWAERVLEGYDTVAEELAGLKGKIAGSVRIALSDHATGVFLAPFLREFVPRFPAVRFVVSTTDRLVNLVEDGFDLALHTGKIPDSGLIGVQVRTVHRILCASPAYLQRRGTPATIADLAAHDCITHSPTEPGTWFFRHGGKLVRKAIEPLVTVDSYYSLIELGRCGLGIIRLSRNAVREDIQARRLIQVLPEYECAQQEGDLPAVWLLYPDRRMPRRVRVFIEEFSRYMKQALP